MKRWLGKIRSCIATVALVSSSAGSLAVIVSSGSNNPLAFAWSYNTGLSLLTGAGSMTFSGFNGSALSVNVTLSNTSALASDKLIAFGFGIDSDATGAGFGDALDGGIVDGAVSGGTNLGNGAIVEVCVWAGANCQSDINGGIASGSSDSFAVILGGIWGNSVSIDPLGFKYHTGYGPQAFTSDMTGPPASSGGSSGSTGSSGTAPEPGTLALTPLGLGLLAAGFAWRRRREHRPSSA